MRLDQTRFEAFWENPEKYRLKYELNLIPKSQPYGLQRGIAFHVIADCRAAGMKEVLINQILTGELPDLQGRVLQLSKEAISKAWVMWKAYEKQQPLSKLIGSELEFEFPLFDSSPHTGVGRLDRIIEHQGKLWVHEFKTAAASNWNTIDKFLNEWTRKRQADFEILGARKLGYQVEGVLVSYVIESVPPKVFEPLTIRRTENALNLTKLAIYETCNLIEHLKGTVGIDVPWIHVSNTWPCSKPGACDYECVCGQILDVNALLGSSDWMSREEHLNLMKQRVEVKADQ